MSRSTLFATATALIVSGSLAGASPPQASNSHQPLVDGLHALGNKVVADSQTNSAAQTAQPNVQPGQPDNDQGDEHASDTAILKVCSHSNPSAQHAAICPQSNSPH